jgi:enamine deaminase RidA (YjgF/YER057c/UK114 family)
MSLYQSPFPNDPDRHEIWTMLVERDIRAFIQFDWTPIADDFVEEGFMGIDGRGLSNPDGWRINFATLDAYREEWLRQARQFAETAWAEDPEAAIYAATTLRDIEISGDSALVHKKFDGRIRQQGGGATVLNWQTLYRCRKVGGKWKIAGFTGYLPHPMGTGQAPELPAKREPVGAAQHVTAGPYSPVLQINPGQLVVISGQASIDPEGTVIGDTIEEQTRYTLDNCRKQLETAGCTLADVFKVNVYLTDLDLWPRMNEVYKTYFPAPRPVRTAVGTALLMTLLVEIEMWAVKK